MGHESNMHDIILLKEHQHEVFSGVFSLLLAYLAVLPEDIIIIIIIIVLYFFSYQNGVSYGAQFISSGTSSEGLAKISEWLFDSTQLTTDITVKGTLC